MKKIYQFLKITTKWIGMLPFSGRLILKPALFSVYGCRGKKKFKRLTFALIVLILFIAGHSFQAYLGYSLFKYTGYLVVKIVAVIYATVNVLVTYCQVFLFFRVTIHCLKRIKTDWRKKRRRKKISDREIPEFSVRQQIIFASITLAGQIIFFLCQTIFS